MELWTALLDILILLGAAMLLGGVCERIKQSPLLGYLLAGVLLGPNALNVLPSYEAVYTIAELGDLTFTVTLRDGSGTTSSVDIGAYGGGVEEPYQRDGAGEGVGWFNEFETIRIRLTDFLTNGSGLDLTDVEAVRLDFGPSFGSNEGRLGLDDVELTNDCPPLFVPPKKRDR